MIVAVVQSAVHCPRHGLGLQKLSKTVNGVPDEQASMAGRPA